MVRLGKSYRMNKLLILDKDPRIITFLRKLCKVYSLDYYPRTAEEEKLLHYTLDNYRNKRRSPAQRERSRDCIKYLLKDFFGSGKSKKFCFCHCSTEFDSKDIFGITVCEEFLGDDIIVLFTARNADAHLIRRINSYGNNIRKGSFIDKINSLYKREVAEVFKTFLEA